MGNEWMWAFQQYLFELLGQARDVLVQQKGVPTFLNSLFHDKVPPVLTTGVERMVIILPSCLLFALIVINWRLTLASLITGILKINFSFIHVILFIQNEFVRP